MVKEYATITIILLVVCSDINECLSSNGGCTHNCSNTDGSFVCSCDSGYELGTDGMACNGKTCDRDYNTDKRFMLSDINECLSSNGGCAHNCSNTDGSFVCSCVSGYELGTDGMACNGKTFWASRNITLLFIQM